MFCIPRSSSRRQIPSFLPVVLLLPVIGASLAGCLTGERPPEWRTDAATGLEYRALSADEKDALNWEGEGKIKAYVFRAPGLLDALASERAVNASFVVDGKVVTTPLHLLRVANVTRQVDNQSVTFPQRILVEDDGPWRGFVSEYDGLMAYGKSGERNVVVQTHAPMLDLGQAFQDGDFVSYSWVEVE